MKLTCYNIFNKILNILRHEERNTNMNTKRIFDICLNIFYILH